MIEKNSDVERAVAAMGGAALPYHSFGPLVLRPRITGQSRPFTYNEFGEPEYAPQPAALPQPITPAAAPPAMMSLDPMYDTLPVVQPPVNRPAAAMPQQAPAAPLRNSTRLPQQAPLQVSQPPAQPMAQPMAFQSAVPPMPPAPSQSAPMQPAPMQYAPAPQMAPPPMPQMQAAPVAPPPPAAPPPPPFFPLLAAAMPNAVEPAYTPYYPQAQPAAQPYAQQYAGQGHGAGPETRGPAPQSAPPAAGAGDHRSLADMFTMLAGRAATAPQQAPTLSSLGVPQAAAAPSEGQALFRRI